MAEISAEWHWEGVEWLGGGEKTGARAEGAPHLLAVRCLGNAQLRNRLF
jgi:hypothetical protein